MDGWLLHCAAETKQILDVLNPRLQSLTFESYAPRGSRNSDSPSRVTQSASATNAKSFRGPDLAQRTSLHNFMVILMGLGRQVLRILRKVGQNYGKKKE